MIANLSILKWWLLLFVSEHEANEAADEVSRFKDHGCEPNPLKLTWVKLLLPWPSILTPCLILLA